MAPSQASGETRQALAAGIASYVIWGLVPLLFQALHRLGATPWEILANRTVWAVPTALIFVLAARQGGKVLTAIRSPRVLLWLAASSVAILVNWSVYIWAVNAGHVLETSLGYYLNPLLNMAAGAALFREKIPRIGLVAIALAAVGVAIQALALGHLPVISLTLACSFCIYGIVRKRVDADAQTGLLVECVLLGVFGLAYVLWLQAKGVGLFGANIPVTALLLFTGPATAAPLLLFSWAARRLPLSALGFLQFIAPTMTFVLGVTQGEPFTPARAVSFLFIWGGAAVFAYGAWSRARAAAAQSPA